MTHYPRDSSYKFRCSLTSYRTDNFYHRLGQLPQNYGNRRTPARPSPPKWATHTEPPRPHRPTATPPSPVKQSSPPSNAAHQDILANIEQRNRSLLVAQQALTCKLVLSISLSQQGMSVRPSRRTLTRVASAAVASLVIVAPISTVSNADALSPTSLPWTNGADEAPAN